MNDDTRIACYQLLAELLVYPEARDQDRIRALSPAVADASEPVRAPLAALLAAPELDDVALYLETLELSPKCPLYLGDYLYDEPDNCRGAASGKRNGYMIEVGGVYRHFGLELDGRELPDFLPVVLEFLALSLDLRSRDSGGLRTAFVEQYVAPALLLMAARFDEHGGVWSLAITALRALLDDEAAERRGVSAPIRSPRLRQVQP